MRRTIAGLLLALALAQGATAQDGAWVQVEALPSLGRAEDAARRYAALVPEVQGYALGSGWYGIALGPYPPDEARALLARLRSAGAVPGDSYVVDGGQFGDRFWPAGPPPAAEAPAAEPAAATTPALPDETPDETPEETPEEARASEELLTQAQKERLQVALQWAGVYDGAIDGAYGRGTRSAMAAWQASQGREATGVLTAAERAALLGQYDAILDGLDLRLVRDAAAGIEMEIPLGVVAKAATEPPFVRYDASGDLPAQVLLISQPGDRDRLWGLYEIMQTLEVVPASGARERRDDGFTLEGLGRDRVSWTEVTLEDGHIKGFALVWPAGDEERRQRLLSAMRASFARLPGVLDPGAGTATEDQSIDLVSGLQVRQPRATASGFYVDAQGTVVTTAAAVAQCDHLTLDESTRARVLASDPAGLAILTPETPLAPRAVAAVQTAVPRLGAEVAVAGYPYGGALRQPALTFGALADLRGLDGEDDRRRLTLTARPGDAGGPVLDAGGAVLGMLLPRAEADRGLPADAAFALDAEAILAALARAGVEATATGALPALTPERLTREAAGLTVLVGCW